MPSTSTKQLEKGKERVIDEKEEEQLPRKRPRTIGLKKALAKEKEAKDKYKLEILVDASLCCGSYDLADLEIPNDKTTSNHFGISRSSPPRSREGSFDKGKEIYIFEVQF